MRYAKANCLVIYMTANKALKLLPLTCLFEAHKKKIFRSSDDP